MESIFISDARPEQAPRIATLIMQAMNHDCCQWFAGENHTLEDFHALMTRLVRRNDSQYSWKNTLVAMENGFVVGILVSYDGAELHRLRCAFVEEALATFGRDFSQMDDETSAGELYLDSLCVDAVYRGRGIATRLLRAAIARAAALGINRVGLLVDQGNPSAEKLYRAVGFRYNNDAAWGGHPMRHLVFSE